MSISPIDYCAAFHDLSLLSVSAKAVLTSAMANLEDRIIPHIPDEALRSELLEYLNAFAAAHILLTQAEDMPLPRCTDRPASAVEAVQ